MELLPDIVFEKQDGNLCAQHALNALLQGDYFTAVDLAEIGQELDRQESTMTGRDASGNNHDESGYFSVEVIQQALSIWKLRLIPWGSEEAEAARHHPEKQHAYICHMHQHWFALRRFASFWYDLNSMRDAPTPLSDTYMSMLLQEYQREGYMVFIVEGELPTCKADHRALLLLLNKESDAASTAFPGTGHRMSSSQGETTAKTEVDVCDMDEKRREEMRRKRLAYFDRNKNA